MNCRLMFNRPSQFFHRHLLFSGHAKLRATHQHPCMTPNLCGSLRVMSLPGMCTAR